MNESFSAVEAKLKDHLDPLLYHLFPDGPTGRDSGGVRFGSKGSLAVRCHGEKAGLFFDFENQEGGGPLQIVSVELFRVVVTLSEFISRVTNPTIWTDNVWNYWNPQRVGSGGF